MDLKDDAIKLGAVVIGIGAVVWYMKSKGLFNLDPTDSDNIINRGFTSVYQGVTGSTGTLGTDIYDMTHDGALDVTSGNNVIYGGVNGIGGAVAGDPNWTLGGWIYDITH